MRLNGKRIADLTAEDIGQLVFNKVPESITLEYKAEGPALSSDGDKKEFLGDLSAMANTNGGLLIFGIKEAKEDGKNAGYPEEITGIKDPRNGNPVNVEQLKQVLDSVIRDNLAPRLSGIEYAPIQYEDRLVFIIGVPRSLQSPHMITFKSDTKFYKRTNSGKYQMDVREIREAMLRTSRWKESAEQFREVRINAKHRIDTGPIYGGTVLLHVIPLGDRETIDLKGKRREVLELFPEIVTNRDTVTFNLDGLKKHSTSAEEYYYQIYRNGGMESCEIICHDKDADGSWQVQLPEITNTALKHLHHYMEFAKNQNITAPFVVFLSVIRMGKAYVRVSHIGKQHFSQGEDMILFPGVVIDEDNANLPAIMQSTFDILYQACGLESCNVYDSAGNYTFDYLR
ncbi:hypothetical protein GCM10008018_45170 [Paenibacillus marchantiophytorum]|uniref:Schlafen AlbA-2 domain-containing protein n=1 Tax=Paenibacillus marchantiophytorum TaxID=1619310 RepID=A0ABQ1EZI9_9BACL|nr:ATP-binding protein [Paenibacillus marchantiophytorum]GFZ93743.1 hypothetical protein GCM10008018_45170 [Paenibacillus marchantiophytorum]